MAAAGTAAAAGASAGERARTSPGRGASSIDETDSRRPEPGVTGGFSPPLSFDPFSHARRVSRRVAFGPCAIGGEEVVAVEVRLASPLEEESAIRREIDAQAGPRVPAETRADLVEACLDSEDDLERVGSIRSTIRLVAPCLALSARPSAPLAASLVRSLGGTTGDSAPEGTAQDLSSSNPPEAGVSSPAWDGPGSMRRSRAGTSSTPLLGRLDRCVLPARPLLDLLRGRAIDPLDLPVLTGCPLLIEGNADELLDLLGLERRKGVDAAENGTVPARAIAANQGGGARPPAEPTTTGDRLGASSDAGRRSAGPIPGSDAPAAVGPAAVATPAVATPAVARAAVAPAAVAPPASLKSALADASAVHEYRRLAAGLADLGLGLPIVLSCDLRHDADESSDLERLLGASVLLGSLLCDGIGDAASIVSNDTAPARALAFNILQAARVRVSKTEFISCPSCGRTLFDLEETTRRIKERTAHLKGLKISVMCCVVNGPGEMADADFGYVGWGTDRIALFVGKDLVARDIPTAEAEDRLVALIKEHGKWQDPVAAAEPAT